jgi:hypothetical protein
MGVSVGPLLAYKVTGILELHGQVRAGHSALCVPHL